MSTASSEDSGKKRTNVLVLLPLIVFIALAALFFYRLGIGDPSRIPSALIGRPVPVTDLPPLPGLERDGKAVPGVTNAAFQGADHLIADTEAPRATANTAHGGRCDAQGPQCHDRRRAVPSCHP